MFDERIETELGICLVGGGDVSGELLAKALNHAPFLVAADGGADRALDAGHTPRAVIGDFDSISAQARDSLCDAQFVRVDEQDTTDFEKCLARIGAPFVLAVGFDGGRMDHTLAAMSVLARRIGPPCVLLTEQEAIFAPPSDLRLELAAGTRLSLFPMAEITGHSKGLRWPIDGLQLSPLGRIATSNEALGPVDLHFGAPGMLIVVPSGALGSIMSSISG